VVDPARGGGLTAARASAGVVAAFHALASDYDGQFTATPLGRLLRDRVWETLDACFLPGAHVLDLGCGTGEDAVHLAARGVRVTAVDAAPAMAALAHRKARDARTTERIAVAVARIEDLPLGDVTPNGGCVAGLGTDGGGGATRLGGRAASAALDRGSAAGGGFDGAFANFGALNCIADMRNPGAALGGRLKPGAPLVAVMMGPLCLGEIAWQLAHASPRKAVRRLRRGGTLARIGGNAFMVKYPTAARLARDLAPAFLLERVFALGTLLPPSYASAWLERRPALLDRLNRADRFLAGTAPAIALADHYVATFRKRDAP
jgi:SAM-dependent methyltransferase